MNTTFLKEHFDHLILAGLAILSAIAAVWCDLHRLEGGKWFYGQATGFTGALMLRMNGPRSGGPTPPPLVPGPSTV